MVGCFRLTSPLVYLKIAIHFPTITLATTTTFGQRVHKFRQIKHKTKKNHCCTVDSTMYHAAALLLFSKQRKEYFPGKFIH